MNIRDTSNGFPILPEDGSLDFDNVDINGTINDGSLSETSWGHTGNDLFDKLCIALDSATGNDNGVEVRFLSKTNNNPRIIHFKTGWNDMIEWFRTAPLSHANSFPSEQYTLYNSATNGVSENQIHTAQLPAAATSVFGEGVNNPADGNLAMTSFTFFKSNGPQWAMKTNGSRWSSDFYSINETASTYHQIWVRSLK